MEFKGTKGIWQVDERNRVVSKNRMGKTLMRFEPFTPSSMRDNQKLDAKLIAAAPELLKEMIYIMYACELNANDTKGKKNKKAYRELSELAKAAIKKAL